MNPLSLALVFIAGVVVAALVLGYTFVVTHRARPGLSFSDLFAIRDGLQEGGAVQVQFYVDTKPAVISVCGVEYPVRLLRLRFNVSPVPQYLENGSQLLLVYGDGREAGLVSNVVVRDLGSRITIRYATTNYTGYASAVLPREKREVLRVNAVSGEIRTPYLSYTFNGAREIVVEEVLYTP